MQAARVKHNDKEGVRRGGAAGNKLACLSRRMHNMENRQRRAAHRYSQRRFTAHLSFVMPCRARKLSSQVEGRQGISLCGPCAHEDQQTWLLFVKLCVTFHFVASVLQYT